MSGEAVAQQHAALDLTYVLYNEDSHLSHLLALLTLTPILLNPAYAALAVQTRELVFVEMWAGQMLCEAFNWVLKSIVKQERPYQDMGSGHGFPSSHSQWMGYFAAFLVCHFTFRHRFFSTGLRILDYARNTVLYLGIISWSVAVAYSRYHLTYHTGAQVIWGFGIGILFGSTYYTLIEIIPMRLPNSVPGRVRAAILSNPVSTWFRLRDGWAVYPDGGTEKQWQLWRKDWDSLRLQNGGTRKNKTQ